MTTPDEDPAARRARLEAMFPEADRERVLDIVLETLPAIQQDPDNLEHPLNMIIRVTDVGGEAAVFQVLIMLSDIYLDHITGGLHSRRVHYQVDGVGYVEHSDHGRVQLEAPSRAVEWMGALMQCRARRDGHGFIAEHKRWIREMIALQDVDDTDDPDAPFLWPMLMTVNVALGLVHIPRGAALSPGVDAVHRLGASWN